MVTAEEYNRIDQKCPSPCDDRIRILAVKESLGIVNEPASEELVDRLCLRIAQLETNKETCASDGMVTLEEEEMEDIQGRLSMDSSNSSIPPRANGYRKPKAEEEPGEDDGNDIGGGGEDSEEGLYTKNKSLREPSGLKPGKQKGSKGHGLKKPGNAVLQDTVYHVPEKCINCPHLEECKKNASSSDVRHVYDAVTTITDTPHVTLSCKCPMTEERVCGEFPEDVGSTQQYGINIKTMVIVLNVLGMVSVDRIHEILSACYDLPISTGSIQKWIENAGGKVKPVILRIMEALVNAVRIHCDETGIHIKGKLHWIHTVCNEYFTYLSIQAGRGYDSICNVGILPGFKGIVIHDCLAGYWKFKNVIHGICCAHLQRELKWIIQFKKKHRRWAQKLYDLLGEMNLAVKNAKERGCAELEPDRLKDFNDRFDALIDEAIAKNPMPAGQEGKRGRKKKGKVLSLVLRMRDHKDEIFLFATDFNATYSNNIAEASFRMITQKRAVIGNFRSEEGANAFVDLFSYLSTCRKHNINCYVAISELMKGNAESLLFGKSEEKMAS